MRWSIQECATIKEYREDILRLTQEEVAVRAKKSQGWISQVELGHLPRPRMWAPLLKAYGLDGEEGEREFVRLVTNAARLRDLKVPMAEQYPLLAAKEA